MLNRLCCIILVALSSNAVASAQKQAKKGVVPKIVNSHVVVVGIDGLSIAGENMKKPAVPKVLAQTPQGKALGRHWDFIGGKRFNCIFLRKLVRLLRSFYLSLYFFFRCHFTSLDKGVVHFLV